MNRHATLILMLAGSVGLPYLTSNPGALTGNNEPAASEASQAAASASSAVSKSAANDTAAQASGAAAAADRTAADRAAPSGGAVAEDKPTRRSVTGGTFLASHETDKSKDATAGSNIPPLPDGPPVEGKPPRTLHEVFDFNITVPWVMEHWPRVTTGLSELSLQGYRVPLVTGTAESDLAGSLTFYFDKNQRLERIMFHGTSGDPRALVALVTHHFQLERVIANDPGLAFYQRKSWGKSHSELHIRPASVIRADLPTKRFEIDMALKRP